MPGISSELDCLVCMMRQALNTSRLATKDEEKQRKILNLVSKEIEKVNLKFPPAQISKVVYEIVREVSGVEDPFKELKEKNETKTIKFQPT